MGMAQQATAAGRLDEAKQLLDRVVAVKKFHTTEFSVLTSAQINYHLALKDQKSAKMWLNLLEKADPEDPNLPAFRKAVLGKRGLWPFGGT